MSKYTSYLFLAVLFFFSCKEEKEDLVIPDSYDASTFEANNDDAESFFSTLEAFKSKMDEGKTMAITASELSAFLTQGGAITINNSASSYYAGKIAEWIPELANASGGTYNPDLTPAQNGEGGVYGSSSKYLFDENGVELKQWIEKGLFASLIYNKIANDYFSGEVTLEDADKALALYGAHPDFANSNKSANHANPDRYVAGYLCRRDDGSGSGPYLQVKQGFLKLQAALKGGSDYDQERDEAIEQILLNMEEGIIATAINYAYQCSAGFSVTNPTDDDKSKALHAWGELTGFIHGFRQVDRKVIDDNDGVSHNLEHLSADYDQIANPTIFIGNATTIGEFEHVIEEFQSIYGFSASELTLFESNQVDVREP